MIFYGAEAWILLSTDIAVLRVFERKVLRKLLGSVQVVDDFRIQSNSELYELLPIFYDAEAWTLLSTNIAALRVFERKVLRKILGPMQVGDDFRIRSTVSCIAP